MTFSDLDLTPTNLERLRREAALRTDYIDLSSSNPTLHGFLFPPDILRESADAYWRIRRYDPHPKGSLRAREAVARYYARRQPPLDISPEDIFITASTSEAYSLLFSLLTSPGDNVLAPVPSYPLFEHLAAMHQVTLQPYELQLVEKEPAHNAPAASQWEIYSESLVNAVDDRTRALLLISPHNPTGHVVLNDGHLYGHGNHALLVNRRIPIIADEVFCEFPYAAASVPPLGALVRDATVFHLNGISKMFALPDLKLGWIALSGPDAPAYVERLELLNDTLLSANSLTQFMLPSLFDHGGEFVDAMRLRIQQSLKQALTELNGMRHVRVAPPLGGTYLFPEIVGCDDEDGLVEQMLADGVFAHPGYFYDEQRGCHLMISALLAGRQLHAGLERLGRILAAHG